MAKQKILIIGGSGFIGHTLVPTMLREGHEVTILNRGNRPMNGAQQIIVDRSKPEDVKKTAESTDGFNVVIDTSAYTRQHTETVWTYFSDKADQWIHLSSAAVYAETQGRCASEKDPIGGSPVWGQYGIDKSEADQFLIDHAGKIPVTIFRPPYIYGPRNSVDRETFVWKRVLQGRPIIIPGDGQQPIQFVHVEEVVSVFMKAMNSAAGRANDTIVYNVASDETPTLNEWVDIVAKVPGMPYT
ncbi:MAG: NAD-dependent epimerase/dehydratase [Bacteroidetes bacterium]|nr:NAD-dependent epimerase/dehydratase [Bacteroidota bacterium]